MRLLTAAAVLVLIISGFSLLPARADEAYGPQAAMTRAQIGQMLADQNKKFEASKQFAKHISSPIPMAKQISSSLNNDGSEAITRRPPQLIRQNGFGSTIGNRAATQKMYNPNDDSVVPQNPWGRRPPVHYMFQRPGTPVTANNFNN
jgi:hypothetical protein